MERAAQGERTVCIDEMTGIQALERKFPDLPMRPGKRERQEFEYIRHGTQTLIPSFDVASGQVIQATVGDTRTEADYLEQVKQTIATDPSASKWHLIMDCLNTHQSESLVRFVWFSILVRKLLRRASFTSKAKLKKRILEFIDYFNRTMAKPFKWTYQGKALRC